MSNYNKILLRYGEIFLKGKNRNHFENALVRNIKKITGVSDIVKLRSRYVVDYFDNHNSLKRVFGLVSYSLALEVEKDIEKIKEGVKKLIESDDKFNGNVKFKVSTKRSDKRFPMKSPEINVEIGKFIEPKFNNLEFSLKNFDIEINIEINQQAAYIFIDKINCFGGLPSGVEGKAYLFCEDEKSILAGLLVMKRGVDLEVLSLIENYDLNLLQRFSPKQIRCNSFTSLGEVNSFLSKRNNPVIVLGNNFDSLSVKEFEKELVVLRPLIAFSDEEIEGKLKEFKGC